MAKENYGAGSIQVLEGLEAVRVRPGMYIGSTGRKGLNHLIYEIVDNSVDEHLAGFCSRIEVILEADGSCTVSDDGRGIPVDMHEKGMPAERLVFTTLHAGGKFDNEVYKTSGGLHGVGSSVVNALSKYLDVRISRGGKIYHDRYERGVPVEKLDKGLLPVIGKSRATGTTVNFLPDDEIFEKTRFKSDEVKSRLHETTYLNPELTIVFTDRRDGKEEVTEFHEPEGIIGFVKEINKNKEVIHQPVFLKGSSEGIEIEIAFQYVKEFQETVLGFCNNIYNSEGGTHITGFKTQFTTVMNNYARELGILKDKDSNFTGVDIRNGMTAIISVKHPDPRFEGQTKTKLDNPDASRAAGKVTGDEMNNFTCELQAHFSQMNMLYNSVFKEIQSVYSVLDVLDKEYLTDITKSLNASVKAFEKAQSAQDDINKGVRVLEKTVGKLKEFSEKLKAKEHFEDIDTMWTDICSLKNDIVSLSKSANREINSLKKDVLRLQKVSDSLNRISHLHDIDAIWKDLHDVIERLSAQNTRFKRLSGDFQTVSDNLGFAVERIEALESNYEKLNEKTTAFIEQTETSFRHTEEAIRSIAD